MRYLARAKGTFPLPPNFGVYNGDSMLQVIDEKTGEIVDSVNLITQY